METRSAVTPGCAARGDESGRQPERPSVPPGESRKQRRVVSDAAVRRTKTSAPGGRRLAAARSGFESKMRAGQGAAGLVALTGRSPSAGACSGRRSRGGSGARSRNWAQVNVEQSQFMIQGVKEIEIYGAEGRQELIDRSAIASRAGGRISALWLIVPPGYGVCSSTTLPGHRRCGESYRLWCRRLL